MNSLRVHRWFLASLHAVRQHQWQFISPPITAITAARRSFHYCCWHIHMPQHALTCVEPCSGPLIPSTQNPADMLTVFIQFFLLLFYCVMQEWSLDSEECQVFLEKTGGDLHWPDCKGGLNTHECAPSHAVIIWNCWAGVKAQRTAPGAHGNL